MAFKNIHESSDTFSIYFELWKQKYDFSTEKFQNHYTVALAPDTHNM